ncbi:uncharacterized protein DS421_14g464170 [Arachis hypogaea]|nr:uncharacterized protein DS421_14g464170 [Arachis hypogaea]
METELRQRRGGRKLIVLPSPRHRAVASLPSLEKLRAPPSLPGATAEAALPDAINREEERGLAPPPPLSIHRSWREKRGGRGAVKLPPTSATARVRRRCAVERKAVQSRRAGETERSEGVLGTQPPCLATDRVTGAASVGTAAIRKGFWSPGVVLRLPGPPPELLATSAVAGKIAVDPPELLAAAGAVAGPVRNRSCFVLLIQVVEIVEKASGAELLPAVDFELRLKGFCDAFELWNLRFELAFELISGFELLKRNEKRFSWDPNRVAKVQVLGEVLPKFL